MELRDEIAEILGEFYNFGPMAYPQLADPVVNAILALPTIKRALRIKKDYDAAKDLGPTIESTPNNAFYNSPDGQEWIAKRGAKSNLGPSV